MCLTVTSSYIFPKVRHIVLCVCVCQSACGQPISGTVGPICVTRCMYAPWRSSKNPCPQFFILFYYSGSRRSLTVNPSALSTPSIFCLPSVSCGALTKSSPIPSPTSDLEDRGHGGRPRKHSSEVEKHIKLHFSSRHLSGCSRSRQHHKEN